MGASYADFAALDYGLAKEIAHTRTELHDVVRSAAAKYGDSDPLVAQLAGALETLWQANELERTRVESTLAGS